MRNGLIQYFKPIKNKKISELECAMGDTIINDDDTGILKNIREDVRIIHDIVFSLDYTQPSLMIEEI